jgi:hypothetical protein
MITLETALAACFTFFIGGLCGALLFIKCYSFALAASPELRKKLRRRIDECDAGETEVTT